MQISNTDSLKSILKRYKLGCRILDFDNIEVGAGHPIKYLLLYYLYLPLIIGVFIVFIGFFIDFILLKFCGLPFIIYSLYGSIQIVLAVKENLNTLTIKNGEVTISQNKIDTVLKSENVKEYIVKTELIEKEIFKGQLLLVDELNNEHLIFKLIDDDMIVLKDNLDYLNKFIQIKLSNTYIV